MTPILDRGTSNNFGRCFLNGSHSIIILMIIPPLALLIVFSFTFVIVPSYISAYGSHDPILIDGNDEFIPANGIIGGTGAVNDPYVIAEWEINTSAAHGIDIMNTNAHLIIRNVYIYSDINTIKYGIYLRNVSNVSIDDVILTGNFHGIWIKSSDNFTLNNSLIFSNIRSGSIFEYCVDFEVTCNTLEDNTGSNSHAIHLSYSSRAGVSNNNLTRNNNGIWLDHSSESTVYGNNISSINSNGIWLTETENSSIIGNTVNDNMGGIRLHDSTGIQIYNNNIIDNWFMQASDNNGGENSWSGNYWSDYSGRDDNGDGIGDTPYTIDADSMDSSPLMEEFIIPEFSDILLPIALITASALIARRLKVFAIID